MQQMGMKDIRVKNLIEIVNNNKVTRVKHYNDTAFYMVSEAQYLKLTGKPPRAKR